MDIVGGRLHNGGLNLADDLQRLLFGQSADHTVQILFRANGGFDPAGDVDRGIVGVFDFDVLHRHPCAVATFPDLFVVLQNQGEPLSDKNIMNDGIGIGNAPAFRNESCSGYDVLLFCVIVNLPY